MHVICQECSSEYVNDWKAKQKEGSREAACSPSDPVTRADRHTRRGVNTRSPFSLKWQQQRLQHPVPCPLGAHFSCWQTHTHTHTGQKQADVSKTHMKKRLVAFSERSRVSAPSFTLASSAAETHRPTDDWREKEQNGNECRHGGAVSSEGINWMLSLGNNVGGEAGGRGHGREIRMLNFLSRIKKKKKKRTSCQRWTKVLEIPHVTHYKRHSSQSPVSITLE